MGCNTEYITGLMSIIFLKSYQSKHIQSFINGIAFYLFNLDRYTWQYARGKWKSLFIGVTMKYACVYYITYYMTTWTVYRFGFIFAPCAMIKTCRSVSDDASLYCNSTHSTYSGTMTIHRLCVQTAISCSYETIRFNFHGIGVHIAEKKWQYITKRNPNVM